MVPSGETGRALADIPDGQLTYQEAKRHARDADEQVRRALARRQDVPPEILYFLADDPDPAVRRAIVRNHSTPALAHLVLVDDQDETVRADLAERIVRLAPGLTSDERDRARQTAYRVLERLVRDQLPRVRQIISEALKDVADAPPEIINRLARDVEEAVCSPVLQFSPVLRDEDLLDIIGENPSSAALSAISRRHRVGADVSDAIAATDDAAAIAILLANPSAQIREETLDALITRSEARPEWQEPLVQRPEISNDAAVRLARFVADRLIQVLVDRQDLSTEAVAEVKRVVHLRLAETPVDAAPVTAKPGSPAAAAGSTVRAALLGGGGTVSAAPMQRSLLGRDPFAAAVAPAAEHAAVPVPVPVEQLDTSGWTDAFHKSYLEALSLGRHGLLGDDAVIQALKNGDENFTKAALAVRAGLSPDHVQVAVASANARGLVAILWRAGLSANWSSQIQARLGKIPPRDVVMPAAGAPYGLPESELEWQLRLLEKKVAQSVGAS